MDKLLKEVNVRLAETRRVWIHGPVGSGRTTLLMRLTQEHPLAMPMELLDLQEADATAHALLSAASEVATPDQKLTLFSSDWHPSPSDKAREIGRWLAQANRLLIVRIPASWRSASEHQSSDWEQLQSARAAAILKAWWDDQELRVIFISTRVIAKELGAERALRLPDPDVDLSFLEDASAWGSYAPHARTLVEMVRSKGVQSGLHPLPVRLAVGALALAEQPQRVLDEIMHPSARAVPALSRLLQERLRAPENRHLWLSVQRFFRIRIPSEATFLSECTGISEQHLPLLTHCIGYGSPVRISEQIRLYLRESVVPTEALRPFHATTGDMHSAHDGACSPWELRGPQLTSWLEKVHHYAHAGANRQQQWEAQTLPGPEFYWDRARSLSKAGEYSEAAKLYRACVASYPRDDYSWHYLAFNLHRAGLERQQATEAYQRAVSFPHSSDNPWWNSRLVTFLIERGRIREAQDAWRRALTTIDPDGDRVGYDPWLGENLHFWVAKQWLDTGHTDLALETLLGVPENIISKSDRLSYLRHAILDAQEEELLGHAVYPFHVPVEARWRRPSLLPTFIEDGVDLKTWFVGQVIEGGPSGVKLVYASGSDREHLKLTELTAGQWQAMGMASPIQSKGKFVELGVYSDGSKKIMLAAGDRGRPKDFAISEHAAAYIRRWASQKSNASTN